MPQTPHPNHNIHFQKSSTIINSQKGKSKSNGQNNTHQSHISSNSDEGSESAVRKGKSQAMSYEEREERDHVAAMLRSWEMCAVLGEENGEVCILHFRMSVF